MKRWIPKNLKELSKLANELQAEAKPDLPAFALVKKRFKDTTANDLTKTIIFDKVSRTESTTVLSMIRSVKSTERVFREKAFQTSSASLTVDS